MPRVKRFAHGTAPFGTAFCIAARIFRRKWSDCSELSRADHRNDLARNGTTSYLRCCLTGECSELAQIQLDFRLTYINSSVFLNKFSIELHHRSVNKLNKHYLYNKLTYLRLDFFLVRCQSRGSPCLVGLRSKRSVSKSLRGGPRDAGDDPNSGWLRNPNHQAG